jgi:perosamine synthetase
VIRLDLRALGLTFKQAGQHRNQIMQELARQNIYTRQGTYAVHLIEYYRKTYKFMPEDFPNSLIADRLTITLPLFSGMKEGDIKRIYSVIKKCR